MPQFNEILNYIYYSGEKISFHISRDVRCAHSLLLAFFNRSVSAENKNPELGLPPKSV